MLAKKKENVSRSAAALTSKTPFQIVEAYKAIRANLLFMLSTAAEKAVVVTSAEPSAGKSTTCSNLAITMARRGQGGHRGRRYAQASSAQDFPRQQQQRLVQAAQRLNQAGGLHQQKHYAQFGSD